MRARSCPSGAAGALVCSLIVALAAPAQANVHEVVFAINDKTQLHSRPGEAAPVVGHADEGDELEVLGDQGRWIKVRNGKQVGWVTRSEIGPTKPAEPRRRPERTGFSGKRTADAVKVAIDIDRVRGFDDPQTKAKNVLDLKRGEVVTVIGRGHDGWILVEEDDGAVGWIPASAVKDGGKFAGDPRRAPAETSKVKAAPVAVVSKPRPSAPRARPWLTGGLLATAGAQTFKMEQTGEGEATSLATGPLATVAGRAQMRVRGELWVGLGTMAELGTADLTFSSGTETSQPMSTREIAIDGYAEVGFGGKRYIAARGGVHYATLSVDSERDEPMLIGERIAGATAGLAGAMPVGRYVTLSASVDVMPFGTQRMSRLPEGALHASEVKGAWARATVAMPLPAHLIGAVSYRFGAITAQLTDDGMTPKTASRSDQSHVVTAGVGVAW
jgi:SH3-like domain-containing protein